ncbi:MAG TPA: C25 family cysteine peptidase [Archangium sp.]|uniref:C25 family cysteine peptidase n=1 Tax=Archangium sp. TaxID=1872627 RepID=UPI002E370ADE|nr:C25 family cysteine peptidase [Archangium sp.]HEX5746000.1 C25 family cysteine peptidase [Archangium sp.]
MEEETLVLSGVDASTGRYLVPPLPLEQVARAVEARLRDSLPPEQDAGRFHALPYGISEPDVRRAGWGIVLPVGTPEPVRQALQPLIDHREAHVEAGCFHVLDYLPGEKAEEWLVRHGMSSGDVIPSLLPYYLLLVGAPTEIPFDFQYVLSGQYAVGRLCFESADGYARYARSVIDYERASSVPTKKRVTWWGPRHPGDTATALSADYLLTPLSEPSVARAHGYDGVSFIGEAGTRAHLAEVLHGRGEQRPTLLFTASHGMGMAPGHALQRGLQGALLCQEWTGPGSIESTHYLSAADIADDARLHGLVAFFFACFSAGTPRKAEFAFLPEQIPAHLSPQPFVAALPQRLLSHPNGGALAVLGHVERTWAYSIRPPRVGPRLHPFRNCVGRILNGEPVGHAVRDFRDRFLMATLLQRELLGSQKSAGPSLELVSRCFEGTDARNYVVLGDPAVRVRVELLS